MSTHRPAGMAVSPSRRTVLKGTVAGAFTAAVTGVADARTTAQASIGKDLVRRPIPRSPIGEHVPVVGLGSFMTFDKVAPADRSFIPVVMDRFWRGGGRVIDTSALYGASEANIGEFARQLGITDKIFLADKSWNCGEYAFDPSHALRQFSQTQQRLHRQQLDVVGIHSMTNVGMMLPILRQLKAEGKIRYLGVTSHEMYQYDGMEPLIRSGAVDFIQIRYSIYQRIAEKGLLSLAAEHGVAVMINHALEKGRLHHVVGNRPLPRFATEFGCQSWAEFFLKYVVAHPAVTCVIPASTNPDHVAENLRAMRGELPDRATRRRMVHYLEQIPGFDQIAAIPWYPNKTFTGGLVRLPQPHPAG